MSRRRRVAPRYGAAVLILALLVAGMAVGAIAQIVLGGGLYRVDWQMALIAGLVGSFVGGLLVSLVAGDGLAIRPSGLIGSVVGAVVVTALWQRHNRRARTG